MAAAPEKGQGRARRLDGPLSPHSSPAAPFGGARGGDRGHGRLEAWALLDFFFVPEEEEKEEEAVMLFGVGGLASPHPFLGASCDYGPASCTSSRLRMDDYDELLRPDGVFLVLKWYSLAVVA